MKLTFFIVLISVLSVLAGKSYSQTKTLNLKMKSATVKEVLSKIEDQSEFYFMYSEKIIDVNREVSVNIENQNIENVLKSLFAGTNVSYTVKDRIIVLATPEVFNNDSQDGFQQNSVSGKVTDSSNQPLPGVTVMVKGTSNGAVTNAEGNYTLSNIPENATLQFSFVGMKTVEIPVSGQSVINLIMEEETFGLEEVVAIGYGTQKKKLVTGATIQIGGDDIKNRSTASAVNALQGQSPGLSITKTSGKPNADYKINIRGLGTIGNASPLVIIDNVVGGDMNMLNPGDIESIDILKDAASAAIYGARAANGVILIKTKQGKQGKTSISYDGYYGVQNVAKYVDVLNAPQYIALEEEAYKNIGSTIPNWSALVPDYGKIQDGWEGTNWQNEFTNKNAPIQNHSINLSGGSEFSTFSMGTSYTGQEGIYGQPDAPTYKRYSFRLNSEHVIYKNSEFDVFKLGENLIYNYIDQDHGGLATGNISWNDIRNVVGMHPLMTVYDENGNFTKAIPWADKANPIGSYSYIRSQNEDQLHNLRINPYLEIQPIKQLIIRSSLGYKYNSYTNRSYVPVYNLGGRNYETIDNVNQSQSSGIGYQFENTINYKFNIKDAHNLDVLVGQSIEKNGLGASVSGSNRGSIFDSYEYAYLNNVKTLNPSNLAINGAPWGESSISSFFGRINYDYKEKYLASVIMRADGSSNFAPDKRWGYFPSVAVGWLITNEAFMESASKVLDYLKIRASWGQNGNQAIAPFQYMTTYSFSGGDYYFGPEKNSKDIGAYPNILPNQDVTWETSEQLNLGFDALLFNSRMGINFDWYNKKTKDWLVQAPVPAMWGAAAPYINGGDIENKGIELALTWKDKVGEFSYNINANVAFNTNEVTRIANTEGIIEGGNTIFSTADRTNFYRAQVGYPIGYFYGYKTAGVFQNQAEIDAYKGAKLANTKPGDLIYVDTDKNGVIETKDKTMIGDPNPDAIFGLNVSLAFKGFDFAVSASGVAGNQIASNLRPAETLYGNWPSVYLDRWHGEGTSNRYPRIDAAVTPNWGWNSDIYIENGSYFRIQNVSLGYDFKKLMPSSPFGQTRMYIAVNNLYTFTSYFGSDPEVGYATEGWSKGIDLGFYPSPRTILLGLNLNF